MHIRIRSLRLVAGAVLLASSFGTPASSAGLKDSLATIDTGPFADAACKTAIDSLIGFVDGLGIAAISNLKTDDDSISANLSLPVGGTWQLHLFGKDCSKNVYAFLKPGTDLKFSNMVPAAGTLNELDKLGLGSQAFVLSHTEGSLKAAEAPSTVAAALKAASDGDGAFELDVKPGLTVLGVMDLSKSTYTGGALSFLGFRNSDSKKIAVNALLGAEMLAALLKGSKGKADFTIVGTMPDVTLTLPGKHALPKAGLEFSAEVHPDTKEFGMKVTAEDTWHNALGISGLSLAEVVMDLKAGGETAAELAAATTVGGQELDVSWTVDKADEHTEVEIKLTAPEGKTFKIGGINGLGNVPGIGSLGFRELDVSPAGFGGRLVWKGKELDAAVVKMGSGNKPILMMKTETFHLKDVASAVGSTPLGGIEIPGMILTLAEGDPGSIATGDMPDVASAILGDLHDKSGGHLTLHQGVGMLGVIDAAALGAAGKELGASGELILGGTLGGVFGGSPEIDLYAAFPTFSPKKMPKFLRAAEGVTPQLTLKFKESDGIEADIGVDLVTTLRVDKQDLELDTALTTVVATSGVGLSFSGSLDKWQHAFAMQGLEIENVAVSVEVDADSSVSAGFQGTVVLKDGRTEFEVVALVSPDLAAVGLPKEIVLEIKTNHVSLQGLMDLADVFVGATGDNPVAKAARGKGLYDTLQFDKLPLIDFVEFKNPDGSQEQVQILLATPGATDPALDIDGWGIGVDGRLQVAKKDIAQAKVKLGSDGFLIDGEILIDKLGPLKIKNGKLDAGAGLSDLPHFRLNADAVLLGVEEAITIEFSKEKMQFTEKSKFGQAFTSLISAEATIADVHNPDFDVTLEFQGDLLDTVLGGIETELKKLISSYDGEVKKAQKAFDNAKKSVDNEEKKVDGAIKKAEADAKKATDKIEAAIRKVNGIQTEINKKKDDVHDKSDELHHLHWYEVGKAIKLALEIAGLEIEIGGLYAAKATATAALEVAKAATELTPILFQAGVLAANAAFEVAKGAVDAADLAVKAAEAVLEGLEKLIEEYRKNFHFSEAKFDGSLQALLGNKPIIMDVKFTAFGQNANVDLSFTPTKPEDIAKGIGGMVSKLAGEAVEGIKHAFFGGGSSGHSSAHVQAIATWAHKNHLTKSDGGFQGASWSGQGPSNRSIPMKGSLYKNAKLNRCLIYSGGGLKFSSCDSTKDDHLFRFSPNGDFVAIGSGDKNPVCLTAQGVERGAQLMPAKCEGNPGQKWTLSGSALQMASGECAAVDRHNKLVLDDCKASDKAQQWTTTPIADLEKLSETPASVLYTVSLRDTGTGKCVDVADKIGIAYACDDSDYQVFNLNSDSQLRVLMECVRAQHNSKNAGVYLGKCDGKETKWTWTGLHLQAKGTKLCIGRGRTAPQPFNVTPLQLQDCKEKTAEWELEPTNVDASGRILPAYHMIRSTAYNRCVEIRTKLQVDGIPIPATVLWDCNGDFNQSFSFRWNGEIRSLGKCLAQKGNGVELKDCYRRPSVFQITPAMFQHGGNNNRHAINDQRWNVRKDGLIQKIGSDYCLSVDPRGMQKLSSIELRGGKVVPVPPRPGTVGALGSLLALEKCNAGNKLQKWAIQNTLPNGKKPAPYARLAHTIDSKERCLETSGDTNIRRLVARGCSTSSYQQFALTNYGEIRQMGRCVTADTTKKAFYDGVQLNLQECRNEEAQKFTVRDDGLISQAEQHSTQRCVVEGPVFTPGAALFKHLPPQMQSQMKTLPTFAPVASGPCLLSFQNERSKKCMVKRFDGALASATCKPSDAAQAMAVVGGKLTFVHLSKDDLKTPHIWIDKPMGATLPSTVAYQPATDPKAIADIRKAYDRSGYIWQEKHAWFEYMQDGKLTTSCLATAKPGTPSRKTITQLQSKYNTAVGQWTALKVASAVNPSLKSKIAGVKKTLDAALKDLEKAAAAGALTTVRCSTASSQKWKPGPVSQTTWKTK